MEAITQKKKTKAPIKSYSVSDVGIKKRKVVLRSSNNKLGKLPQIDHRLMLNRKKKMVWLPYYNIYFNIIFQHDESVWENLYH